MDQAYTTLPDFLTQSIRDPELGILLGNIASACQKIAKEVRYGSFAGNRGIAGSTNVQGEDQKPLDIISNDCFMEVCAGSPRLAALVSEEVDDVTWLKEPEAGDFILYFDPLDGSSNLDVNVSVGSIFSVIKVSKDGDRNVLKAGNMQICSGYAAYGPSTMLVLTQGDQVDGFTLDEDSGAYFLTNPQMTIPADTSEYAINTARQRFWDAPIAQYVTDCVAGSDGPRARDFNMRWVGSMVADVHRILMRGGVFIYPVDSKTRAKGGRLRLMYEANPMAMIVNAAGGKSTTGTQPIIDVAPTELHQRIPVILGSHNEVNEIQGYFSKY